MGDNCPITPLKTATVCNIFIYRLTDRIHSQSIRVPYLLYELPTKLILQLLTYAVF